MPKDQVLTARVDSSERARIELAAEIKGRTTSGFLRATAVSEAEAVIRRMKERVEAAEDGPDGD